MRRPRTYESDETHSIRRAATGKSRAKVKLRRRAVWRKRKGVECGGERSKAKDPALTFFAFLRYSKMIECILVWPTKGAGHTSVPLCSRLRRLRITKNAQEISDPIDEQEHRDPDVTPGQSVPCRNVRKCVPAHRQVRGVDMTNVGDGQPD